MEKGIGGSVVVASMSVARFSGEGKWGGGEWGVKRGQNAVPFPGEAGSLGWRQRAREADRVGPHISEGEAVGHAGPGWARISVRGRQWGMLGRKGREGDGPRLGRNSCSG
jgi:hypothetical protein